MASKTFAFGYRFKTDQNWVMYKTVYGRGFKVLKSDIDTVSVTDAGRGKCSLQIMGHGAVLAQTKLPKPWAEKAQVFLLKELGKLN